MALLFLLILLAQVSYFRYILQTIEVIRDPSHVRNYSIKDWVHFIEDAGFELTTLEKQTLKLDFDSWVQRMKTPEDQIKTLRYLQENAADVVKKYFNIQKDGSFESKVGYFVFKNYPSSESKLGFVFIEKMLDKSPHIEGFLCLNLDFC